MTKETTCAYCHDRGWTYADDGNGCVAKEPCDVCPASQPVAR